MPPQVRVVLEDFRRGHLMRMATLSGELCRIADDFTAHDIPFATFKGAALAMLLYGDLAARQYNDIDIIVPEEHVAAAEDRLAALGFHAVQGDRAFRQTFLGYLRQYAFARDDIEMTLDLHWAFGGTHLPFPLATADVWAQIASVQVGGRSIPTISGRNLALLLAGHGTKESWRSLGWVRDFAVVVARHRNLDWSDIYRSASERGCGNAVLLGCALAQALLDVETPPSLAEALACNGEVRSRVGSVIATMRDGLPGTAAREHFADFELWDRRSDRLKAALRLIFTRTVGDYRAMPLPRPFWTLYYLTRLVRLAAKAVGLAR